MPARCRPPRRALPAMLAAASLLTGGAGAWAHDYPTAALADYVFGCMATNGQTQETLGKCACSIDVIASILPFEEYTAAETVLRMRQVPGGGEKMAIFRDTTVAKTAVERLKRAQVEAELRCF
jgi:hypothetical protein